jgi:TolB-like protein/DNA-binding winged helix-turn-helix (wHTH) protein/thioredoxin-like negative regulator of GroEL
MDRTAGIMVDAATKQQLRAADLLIDIQQRTVRRGGETLSLPGLSFDLLLALARAAPDLVSHRTLADTVWSGRVVSPETITQRVKLVRAALGDDAEEPRYIGAVHGRGYRLLVEVTSVPADAPRETVVPAHRARPYWIAAAAAALSLAMAAGMWLNARTGERGAPEVEAIAQSRSIAVLPFSRSSRAGEPAGFLAEGLYDDLLTRLARIDDLLVISRTSAERFRDTNRSARDIAGLLNVSYILEGSVQQSGNVARINLQLIDARTDSHVWARTYESVIDADAVFAAQARIANDVAVALDANLSPVEQSALARRPTQNLEAYEAYVVSLQLIQKRRRAPLEQAVRQLEHAAALDPQFEEAWAALGRAAVLLGSLLPDCEPMGQTVERAVERARALDPTDGEALLPLAEKLMYWDGEKQAALAMYERALELSPRSAALQHAYGTTLINLRELAAGIEHLEQAIVLDPLHLMARVNLGSAYADSGRIETAREQLRKTLEIDPGFVWANATRGRIEHENVGDLVAAAQAYGAVVRQDPGFSCWLARTPMIADLVLDIDDLQWISQIAALERQADPVDTLDKEDTVDWPVARLRFAEFYGDTARMRALAEQLMTLDRLGWMALVDDYPLRVLRDLDLAEGRPQAARARYQTANPGLFDTPPQVTGETEWMAVDLARVLLETGEADQAARLLDAVAERLATRPLTLQDRIMGIHIAALRGEPERALSLLASAIDAGWRYRWHELLERSRNLDTIRERAEFADLLARLRSRVAAERNALSQFDRLFGCRPDASDRGDTTGVPPTGTPGA